MVAWAYHHRRCLSCIQQGKNAIHIMFLLLRVDSVFRNPAVVFADGFITRLANFSLIAVCILVKQIPLWTQKREYSVTQKRARAKLRAMITLYHKIITRARRWCPLPSRACLCKRAQDPFSVVLKETRSNDATYSLILYKTFDMYFVK